MSKEIRKNSWINGFKVKETVAELEELYASTKPFYRKLHKEKIRVLLAVKRKEAYTQGDIAKVAGIDRTTILTWKKTYRERGLKGLLKTNSVLWRFKIKETVKELERLYNQAGQSAGAKIKINMLLALKKEGGITIKDFAKYAAVMPGTIRKWILLYVKLGIVPLLNEQKRVSMFDSMHKEMEAWITSNPELGFSGLYKWVKENHIPGINRYTLYGYVGKHFKGRLAHTHCIQLKIRKSLTWLKGNYQTAEPEFKQRIKMLMFIKQSDFTIPELALLLNENIYTVHKWVKICKEKGIEYFLTSKDFTRSRNISVTESNATLRALFKKVASSHKNRLRMLLLLKANKNIKPSELADACGVNEPVIYRWISVYKEKGADIFLSANPSNRKITDEILNELKIWLDRHPSTKYPQIHKWVEQKYKKEFHEYTLKKYLRARFNLSFRRVYPFLAELKVKESLEELKEKLDEADKEVKKRLRILIEVKQHRFSSFMDLAESSGVSYSGVRKWTEIYMKEGLGRLLESRRNNIRVFRFKVQEPMIELQTKYQESSPDIKPRIGMLLAMKQGWSGNKVAFAKEIDVADATLRKWLSIYKKGGLEKLLEVEVGGERLFDTGVEKAIRNKITGMDEYDFDALYQWVKENHKRTITKKSLYAYSIRHFGDIIRTKKAMRIPVKETIPSLRNIERKLPLRFKPRVRMLIKIKETPAISNEKLASAIHVNVRSVMTWYQDYKQEGLKKLLPRKKYSTIFSVS